MRSAAVVFGLLVGSACGFQSKAAEPDAAPQPDACVSFSTQLDTCALAPTTDLTISGVATYDTAAHVLTSNGSPMNVAHATLAAGAGNVDAILAHDVRIVRSAQLSATGALPFAIVASGKITIEDDALIDVGHGGAGHRTACDGGPTPGGADANGAGGGGGGGFGVAGGAGGTGDGGSVPGGAAGAAVAAIPAGPQGGCPGAAGGMGNLSGGAGGTGGGAIYIVAAGGIELGRAVISAGGGGGGGGPRSTNNGGSGDAGGGGGGSGGMIWLEAPRVIGPTARLVANGGGGGEGSSDDDPGNPGDAASLSDAAATGGRDGSLNGANGGNGGSVDASPQEGSGARPGGGGGGGGGVGFIRVVSADVTIGLFSPARTN